MKKILIIEDHKPLGEEVDEWFKFEGYETCVACNGREGVEHAVTFEPDLVLCDIMMPEMNGLEVLGVLRANEATQLTPFIFMTAVAERANVREGMDLGADDYITKPFTRKELMSTVKTRLHRSNTIHAHAEDAISERTSHLQSAIMELDAFNYTVAHDLRAPLRAMGGFANIIIEEYAPALDDEGKRMLQIISNTASRMDNLIDSLLAFSKLKKAELRIVNIKMQSMVKSVCDQLMLETTRKNIEFKFNDIPDAYGDETLIKQVWVNLLNNAVKYSSKKPLSVIEIGCNKSGNDTVYFVSDNGAGFDMRNADKLFGVFQRLHPSREFEGTGIGLANVKRILEKHGGRIWVEAVVNEGATFYFTLPQTKPAIG